jgi:hypothetical protein
VRNAGQGGGQGSGPAAGRNVWPTKIKCREVSRGNEKS